jgi:2-methylisocitrate lyase-like PEP mutase family enzyme
VAGVEAPVNVLARPGTPPLAELAAAGVRRVSTGGGLAWSALGALKAAVDGILDGGTFGYTDTWLPPDHRLGVTGPRLEP